LKFINFECLQNKILKEGSQIQQSKMPKRICLLRCLVWTREQEETIRISLLTIDRMDEPLLTTLISWLTLESREQFVIVMIILLVTPLTMLLLRLRSRRHKRASGTLRAQLWWKTLSQRCLHLKFEIKGKFDIFICKILRVRHWCLMPIRDRACINKMLLKELTTQIVGNLPQM